MRSPSVTEKNQQYKMHKNYQEWQIGGTLLPRDGICYTMLRYDYGPAPSGCACHKSVNKGDSMSSHAHIWIWPSCNQAHIFKDADFIILFDIDIVELNNSEMSQ